MAIRVRPGIRKTRLMSRTSNVRKAEWDQIRGNHQGQRHNRLINRPDTRLYLTMLAETSKSPCIAGAIHTGHCEVRLRSYCGRKLAEKDLRL